MHQAHIQRIHDLSRRSHALRMEIMDALASVVESGSFVLGAHVEAFEHEFARHCGRKHCVSVANGTDALELALHALQVGAGHVVIAAANAGYYATCAIRLTGAAPAYVDVDPDSGLIRADEFERACSAFRPSAAVVTHLYGRMADMASIGPVAREHGVQIIEDCAQCHGARLGDRRAGSWGELGCFSFYPTKNLGGLGDAGAIVACDDRLAQAIRQLRQYGWTRRFMVDVAHGRNSRMDEIQAAVLRRLLPHLDAWNDRRRRIAEAYCRQILNPRVRPLAGSGSAYVAHLFVIRCQERDSLRAHLADRGIACDVHYPVPDHLQAGNGHDWRSLGLPVTERLASEILTLPCFPEMTDQEVCTVAQGVNEWTR